MRVGTVEDALRAPASEPGGAASGRLTPCADCGHQVSIHALSCPSCGRPFRPTAHGREGPFLQTLNAGCLFVLWSFVAMFLFGAAMVAVQVLQEVLRLGWGR